MTQDLIFLQEIISYNVRINIFGYIIHFTGIIIAFEVPISFVTYEMI